MAGINIPGVNDKYKTNDLVEGLMKVERIPLTREQNTLESYKTQQEAWRGINQRMSSLRDSVKTLYSFENPFNNKLASSSDESAITAEAGREAAYESFKIDVLNPATTDRFLSKEIEKNEEVPAGKYTYSVGEKKISMKWKGGKIEEFISALNKRGSGIIKASLIGVNKGNKALLMESMKTGFKNRLIFEDDALKYALDKEMVKKAEAASIIFGTTEEEISLPQADDLTGREQTGMPELSEQEVIADENGMKIPARGAAFIPLPLNVKTNEDARITFSITAEQVEDITIEINESANSPAMPELDAVKFGGIEVQAAKPETGLKEPVPLPQPLEEIQTVSVLFAVNEDGSEQEIILKNELLEGAEYPVEIDIREYPKITGLAFRNRNTGTALNVSPITGRDTKSVSGYEGVHPISEAGDAVIKYEGITMNRPENKIDDVVPHVTLHVNGKTEKTATIDIKPDTEAAKDALINFVGKYNQAVAELNILSQNKPEIISELDYLSSDEQDEYKKKLGLFFSDFSLSNAKTNMQQIIAGTYGFSENAEVTMLSQIGISTNATNYSGYNPGKMRGYLEIDEKKLDEKLANNLADIRNIFGFDSDGDLIIDSGIGYLMDKQLTAYVQSGGILANKTSVLDRQIKDSEAKISKLESQMDAKEAELKYKYGQMQSTLNNLEGQQNSINNFVNQNNNNR